MFLCSLKPLARGMGSSRARALVDIRGEHILQILFLGAGSTYVNQLGSKLRLSG